MNWAWLIHSGEAENFQFNLIAQNFFPLVKAFKMGFPYTCKVFPIAELGLADQWENDSLLSLFGQPIRHLFSPGIDL